VHPRIGGSRDRAGSPSTALLQHLDPLDWVLILAVLRLKLNCRRHDEFSVVANSLIRVSRDVREGLEKLEC